MADSIELRIDGRAHDLGDGFMVRRLLPYMKRRTVGPFIFFDHMGPAQFAPGTGIDVRPHPHIGLATVTYLFEGEIVHRDSLGVVQPIRPGDVNWMTAGRGIAHSERTGDETRARGGRLHGIQTWVALPREAEETAPAFHHHPAATLPNWTQDGARLRLILGTAYGRTAPAAVFSPIFYVDAALEAGATLNLPLDHEERGLYVAEGAVAVAGQRYETGQMAIFRPGNSIAVTAEAASRLMLFGGAPLDGPRHIWWNFVSSDRERIEQAKRDWAEGRFTPVPGESEFIPLPER